MFEWFIHQKWQDCLAISYHSPTDQDSTHRCHHIFNLVQPNGAMNFIAICDCMTYGSSTDINSNESYHLCCLFSPNLGFMAHWPRIHSNDSCLCVGFSYHIVSCSYCYCYCQCHISHNTLALECILMKRHPLLFHSSLEISSQWGQAQKRHTFITSCRACSRISRPIVPILSFSILRTNYNPRNVYLLYYLLSCMYMLTIRG